ncbi:MAG: PAS domain S-box protein [Desulforhopalus sp.]
MKSDSLLLYLKIDLLENIIEYAGDIKKCGDNITSQIREIIGTRVVAFFECNPNGEYSLLSACPHRKGEVLEKNLCRRLIAQASAFDQAALVIPGEGEVGKIVAELGMRESFFVPLHVGNESLGMLVLLDLMDNQGIGHILDALRDISGLLSLVLKNSFFYRNMETLVEQRTSELMQSESRSRIILQTAMDGFWRVDAKGQLLEVNDTYCGMVGYDRDELLTMTISQLDVLESARDIDNRIREILAGKQGRFETKHRRKDGNYIELEVCTQGFTEGPHPEIVVFLRDITERKRAEEALRASEEMMRSSQSVAHICSYSTNLNVNEIEKSSWVCSPEFYNIFGIEENYPNTIAGWANFIHPDYREEVFDYHESVVKEKKSFSREYKIIRHNDGAERWVHGTGELEYDEKGNPVRMHGAIQDITERRRSEVEKEKLQSQLVQAQKMESVGHLAGGVAHDFNNMLGVILGHTEMALEETDPASSLYADLYSVRQAAERSAALTRQLLAFARKQTVAPKVIDLNETVEGMLKMLRRLIGEDIDLLWRPGANLQPVKVDPAQIDQLLANLCVNARDAIDGVGKVTIITDAKTFNEDYCHDHLESLPGEYILIEVTDDGCGMDKTTLDHIFEPFFTTKEQGKGTGLGLASIYGIVKQNNGFINVYSEPDQGTTFKVYLPVYAAKSAEMAEKVHDLPVEHGSETILLVEDETAILKMTTTMLERLGYTVVAAATPGEAIRLAHEYQGRIDLLMTDVVMPEMNGRELAGNLLSHYPDLKRLFMSGYTANVIAHHGVLDEGVHFIQKPFSKKDLGGKVREALEG